MKKAGIIVLISGCIGFIGAFLPLANAGTFCLSILDSGGLLYLLYIIPIALIVLGSMTLAGKLSKLPHFVVPFSILGGIIAVWGIFAAMQDLEMMSSGMLGNMMSGLSQMTQNMGMGKMEGGTPYPGVGGILLLVGFIGAIGGSFFKGK